MHHLIEESIKKHLTLLHSIYFGNLFRTIIIYSIYIYTRF